MNDQKFADRHFGGFRPFVRDGADVWPPRAKPGWDAMSIIKRIQAVISGGKLVWLRDHDETQTLMVANVARDGLLYSARYWPNFRQLTLHENGTVTCLSKGNGTYVRNWVAAREADMIYMAIQNSEVYAAPLEDHEKTA